MAQHTLTWSYKAGTDNAITASDAPTANAEIKYSDVVPTPSTNLPVGLAFKRANLKSLLIKSDRAITIYTNNPSGGGPTDTIAIIANQALIWSLALEGLSKCPFSADVTILYITNASGQVANVNIIGLEAQ